MTKIMDDIPGRITNNTTIIAGYNLLTIKLERSLGKIKPGQFIMLRIPSREIFLRRPFSIYDIRGKILTIMYRIVGKGTDALSLAPKNAPVSVLGPLGNGFVIPRQGQCLVVAGGIGFAGVKMLLKSLGKRATLFIGVNNKEECEIIRDRDGIDTFISTLDASHGFGGNVVDLLEWKLANFRGQDCCVFACGPKGMLASLKKALKPEAISCQVSVEERMACGMGLCFGCVVETKDPENPFKRVCKEGPVFDLWDLSL
ncbi:MAG: dihydroorotate dehydrogenase electron transfer subunit [Syntrophorhabdus sp.]